MQENFRQFLDRLRQTGDLVDLHQPVDIRHIATLVDQAQTALFFHNVIGYDMPVVSGIIRSRERAIMALGCETYREIEDKLQQAIDRPIPPKYVKSSPTREVVLLDGEVDLYKLPIPMSSIYDGGPMITAGVVITRDPEFGINSGIYRFIVKEKNLTGIDIVTPNNMRMFAQRAYQQGRPLPVSISIGTHPIEITGSGYRAPLGDGRNGDRGRLARRPGRARALPDHRSALYRGCRDRAGGGDLADRLDLAGGPLRRVHAADGRPALEPAGARQGDLHAPRRDLLQSAHAVGEHLAGGADPLCRHPPALKTAGIIVKDINVTLGGCAFWHAVISIKKNPGEAKNALLAALSVMDLKHVVVVDDDIDVFDPMDVEWAIATRVQGDRDIMIVKQCARQAARSEPAAGIPRGADRRQGRHRRHHPGGHSEGALRAHHLCLCGSRQDRRLCERGFGCRRAGRRRGGGGPPWRSRYWTPSPWSRSTTPTSRSGSPHFDFRTVASRRSAICMRPRSSGRMPRGRMCVRGSEFAAKPKG